MSEELIKRLREQARLLEGSINVRSMELLREAADALSRPAPAVQVPEGASVSTDVEYTRVNGMFELSVCVTFPPMTDADANAYGYSQRDALAKSLRAMLATPATVATEAVMQGGGVDDARILLAEILAEADDFTQRTGKPVNGWPERVHVLLASAPAVPVGDGWMPIETAPKDGTVFLIGFNETARMRGARTVYEARWCTAQEKFTSVNGFVLFDGATNWQPLPPAPAATKKEA